MLSDGDSQKVLDLIFRRDLMQQAEGFGPASGQEVVECGFVSRDMFIGEE